MRLPDIRALPYGAGLVMAVVALALIAVAVFGTMDVRAHDPDATPVAATSTEVVLHESSEELCIDVTNFATLAAEVTASNGLDTVSDSGRESISDTTTHCVNVAMKVTADAGVSLNFRR